MIEYLYRDEQELRSDFDCFGYDSAVSLAVRWFTFAVITSMLVVSFTTTPLWKFCSFYTNLMLMLTWGFMALGVFT